MTSAVAPSKLYSAYVFDGNKAALQFWGPIPLNVKDAIALSKRLTSAYHEMQQPLFTSERLAVFCQTVRALHQRHDMLTPMVKQHLELLETHKAAVEAGHQPALFGGPGLIINKLAAIAKIAMSQDYTAIMFVGDHDHEQKELTVMHLPSPGPRGLSFSFTVPREFQQSPMHVLPLPSKSWLKEALEKISSTYHELVAKASKEDHQEYERRVQSVSNIIQTTYDKAETISDWSLQIWMQISNLSQDSGILFQRFSHPKLRQLMLPAFEFLIHSRKRLSLIHALNQAAKKLQELGYQPGIGNRTADYIPFHLECPTKGCNRTRLDPTLTSESSARMEITAHCPKCKVTHQLEIKPTSPDLTEWADFLSPRVDTRAFLVQTYSPVILHIGGAGETSYYAQVSPALQALGSVMPIFFRYTRLYYGNPWTNQQAGTLQEEGLTPLDQKELLCFTKAITTASAEENSGVVRSLYGASAEHILHTVEQLVETEIQLEQDRKTAIRKQRESLDDKSRKEQRAIVGRYTRQRQVLQTYLSQMYGRYSPERLDQEVSFAWIDGAISLGPQNYFTRLLNQYQPYTPASATFFLPEDTNT